MIDRIRGPWHRGSMLGWRWRTAVVWLATAACGRIGFPEHAGDTGDAGDAGDAPSAFGTHGAGGSQTGAHVTVAAGGDVVVTGSFQTALDLGAGERTSRGGYDIYVARYSGDGVLRWMRDLGGDGEDVARSVAVDPAGNAYVTGWFSSTVDFGGGPLTALGATDVFVASFDPDGQDRWAVRLGDSAPEGTIGSDEGFAIAANDDGVYVGGEFLGTVDFGGGPVTGVADGANGFLASFTAAGTPRWSRAIGVTAFNKTTGLALDPDGNVYITGYYTGAADLGGGALPTFADQDIFLASYTGAGVHRWSVGYGGTAIDWGRALAFGGGRLFMTGSYQADLDLGAGAFTAPGVTDGFVAGFSPIDGGPLWSHSYQAACAKGLDIASDAGGNVYVSGTFDASLDLAGMSLTSAGGDDAFYGTLDRDGASSVAERLGDGAGDEGSSIAAGADGRVYLVGQRDGQSDCDQNNFVLGEEDMFVLRVR